jgi:hypothetical protein
MQQQLRNYREFIRYSALLLTSHILCCMRLTESVIYLNVRVLVHAQRTWLVTLVSTAVQKSTTALAGPLLLPLLLLLPFLLVVLVGAFLPCAIAAAATLLSAAKLAVNTCTLQYS